ncbi:MAG: sensor histidine kinase [Spirochaetales bacterium]|nr:sensor histidine kinase [Spirochaetales bacterium]
MKRRFGFGTLQSRIYTIFTLMIFSSIFIMQLVSFRFTINAARNSIIENNRVLLGQLVTQIDSYIGNMEKLADAVIEDNEIQFFLENPEAAGINTLTSIESRLAAYIFARGDLAGILIAGTDGTLLKGEPDTEVNPWSVIADQPWYKEAVDAEGRTAVSTSYVQNVLKGKYSWVVSLSRSIFSAEDGRLLGVLLIDLKFNRINELCRSLVVGRRSYDFILDKDGNYVFHPMQQLVYSEIRSEPVGEILKMLEENDRETYFDGEHYFTAAASALTGWHIVNVTYRGDITTNWQWVQLSYAAIGLVLFIVVGLFTNKLASGITKPVRKLQEIMKSVESGEFHLVGKIEGTDEIRELAREYDIMVTRIRELMQENIMEQELKRKSDLKALQAQINPHFLYNTLDSIIWMGEMKQHREVVQMTSALSKLFRISISKGRELITITEEISHVQSYLTIQEMRYKDKFRYLLDIDPDIHDLIILKITLQPLVENAIYHGIKEVDHQGFIRITGRREGDDIIFEVSDNGKGMNQQQLVELIEGVTAADEKRSRLSRQGLGVRNVHERIRIYFGEGYGLSFASEEGKGTVITVRLPAKTQETIQ